MRYALHPLVLSLSMIGLSFLCFGLARVFERQYAHASGVVSHAISDAKSRGDYSGATLVGLPSPERFRGRVNLMLLASILVLLGAGALAIGRKHWSYWVAVFFAVVGVMLVFNLDAVRF